MKKGVTILIVLTIAILTLLPAAQSLNESKISNIEKPENNETVRTVCYVIGPNANHERIIKEISRENYNRIVEKGKSLRDDFMTVYNPDSTDEEVNIAFDNIRPFFAMIADNELADKSVEELEVLYKEIRNKITEGIQEKKGIIRPTGWWNGLWTPIFFNGGCGITAEAKRCQGFVIGTHSILPGIGFDILLTYFTSDLSAATYSIGVTGGTAAHGPQMAFIINYLGILFGEIPVICYMVFALLIGYAMFYAGASIL